jgi:hypothetical protein
LENLLPHGLAVVGIGNFLNHTTRLALEKLVDIPLSAATFNLIFDHWKQKRLANDFGRYILVLIDLFLLMLDLVFCFSFGSV